jgi:hypothetical protein
LLTSKHFDGLPLMTAGRVGTPRVEDRLASALAAVVPHGEPASYGLTGVVAPGVALARRLSQIQPHTDDVARESQQANGEAVLAGDEALAETLIRVAIDSGLSQALPSPSARGRTGP